MENFSNVNKSQNDALGVACMMPQSHKVMKHIYKFYGCGASIVNSIVVPTISYDVTSLGGFVVLCFNFIVVEVHDLEWYNIKIYSHNSCE